jgi:hypothetical protein
MDLPVIVMSLPLEVIWGAAKATARVAANTNNFMMCRCGK